MGAKQTQPVVAGSGMATFETGIVQICHWLGLGAASWVLE
jgi:hypothetical protein